MDIKKLLPNAFIPDEVNGASWVFDNNGSKIGWYDHEKNIMSIYYGYANTEALIERLSGKVKIVFAEPEDPAKILYGK